MAIASGMGRELGQEIKGPYLAGYIVFPSVDSDAACRLKVTPPRATPATLKLCLLRIPKG